MMFVALFLLSLSLDARGATATAGSRAAAGDAADAGAPTPGGVEYCVVGAGPGGLQAAAMLREAGRDVVVFDKSDKAGSFFARFPIHRRLISINKRHFATYHHEPEFQLRHDWNSLISLRGGVPPGLKFSNYSDEYYPHADALVDYLGDFATRMLDGRVSFETEVTRIDVVHQEAEEAEWTKAEVEGASVRGGDDERNEERKFIVSTNKGQWTCDRVIVATGLSKPSPMPRRLDHPDVIGSGIKDKYVIEKMGVPCKQLHSYDYGGPYAGFKGAVNFFKEIDRMTSSKVWKLARAPWHTDGSAPAAEAETATATA